VGKKNMSKGSGRSLQKVMDCNQNTLYFFWFLMKK
jgi:hypothetical protein